MLLCLGTKTDNSKKKLFKNLQKPLKTVEKEHLKRFKESLVAFKEIKSYKTVDNS